VPDQARPALFLLPLVSSASARMHAPGNRYALICSVKVHPQVCILHCV